MSPDYRTIDPQRVHQFAGTASLYRLMQAQMNIEEYIQKCDYSAEDLTGEILHPRLDHDHQMRILRLKKSILEKRGCAYSFLQIIKAELKKRAAEYEAREGKIK